MVSANLTHVENNLINIFENPNCLLTALADQAALPGGPPVTMQVSLYRTIMIQNGQLGQIKYIF